MTDKPKKRLDKSSEKTEYPYAQVLETESGHLIILDDTPGHSRMVFAHKSGSYTEISEDGKTVNFSVGDNQTYGKGGVSFTVDENNDVKIHGHNRMVVGGGSYIEVAGHAGVAVAGDTTLVSKGSLKASVDNIYLGAKGNMNFNVAGNMEMKVAGTTNLESGGDTTMKASNIWFNK